MANFQERLRELKTQKGVTYKDVADALCIGMRGVQRYAEGKGFPDFQGLLALADYFGVSLDYLVGRTDVPFTDSEEKETDEGAPEDNAKNPFIMALEEAERHGKDLSHSERVRASKLLHMAIDVLEEAEEPERSGEFASDGVVAG